MTKVSLPASVRRRIVTSVAGLVLLASGGCANLPAPVNYAPSSTLTLTGSSTVADFKYLPAIAGKVDPNQLRNTALGSIKVDKNIDIYFRDAVFKELRFVGVKLDDKDHILTGEIKEFLVDDLGYSVDWTIDVQYVVKSKVSGKTLYAGDKVTKNKTAKFVNAFEAMNNQIRLNIEDLIKDPAFGQAIK